MATRAELKKSCPACKQDKPVDEFRGGRKKCENCNVMNRRRLPGSAGYQRLTTYESHVRYRYGLTLPEYDKLMDAARKNGCAICGGDSKRFHMDHDHKTKKVRGVLCQGCNIALGGFRDNRTSLTAAIDYLSGSFIPGISAGLLF